MRKATKEILSIVKSLLASEPKPITEDTIEQVVNEVIHHLTPLTGGHITIRGRNIGDRILSLTDSDKFSMFSVGIELPNERFSPNGKIVLHTIYMKEEWKGKGELGPATQVYKELAKIAENWGTGKLHVYSAGNYTKQIRFWTRVPNAVFE